MLICDCDFVKYNINTIMNACMQVLNFCFLNSDVLLYQELQFIMIFTGLKSNFCYKAVRDFHWLPTKM